MMGKSWAGGRDALFDHIIGSLLEEFPTNICAALCDPSGDSSTSRLLRNTNLGTRWSEISWSVYVNDTALRQKKYSSQSKLS